MSEAHHDLYAKQQRLIEENVLLVNQNRHQHAEVQHLWQKEEHASEIIRRATPQYLEASSAYQSAKEPLQEELHEKIKYDWMRLCLLEVVLYTAFVGDGGNLVCCIVLRWSTGFEKRVRVAEIDDTQRKTVVQFYSIWREPGGAPPLAQLTVYPCEEPRTVLLQDLAPSLHVFRSGLRKWAARAFDTDACIGMYNPVRKDVNGLISGGNGSAFSRVIKPIAINRIAPPSN
jgi:hypothetical protein